MRSTKSRTSCFAEGVVERQHRHRMPDLPEAPGRRRADLLRRRVGADQFGKALFDGREARPQRVVFGIGNAGRIVLVIAPVVALEFEREPHMLDFRLRFAELGDVGECCFLRFAGHARLAYEAALKSRSAAARASAVISAPASMRAISSRR